MKRALVTGINGQDGYYLTQYLLKKGYEVWGMGRTLNIEWDHEPLVHSIVGDLTDRASIRELLKSCHPDEIYNLAGQSDVGKSFMLPEETHASNYDGLLNLVTEAIVINPHVKIYQASSSEMFGNAPAPQDENSPLSPVSPYAVSKAKAYEEIVLPYRAQGVFISCGILYNHESPRRSERFVTRKITSSLVQIRLGLLDSFSLGNVNAQRDWGFAGDYVEAMHLMLQQPMPEDFVIATGITHSVREFVEVACKKLGMKIVWEGSGLDEVAKTENGKVIITINKDFYRPQEPNQLVGNSTKAYEQLGWKPATSFEELVAMMVQEDLSHIKK